MEIRNNVLDLWTPDPYGEGQLGFDYTVINYGVALDTTICRTYTANATNGYTYVFYPIISSAVSIVSIRQVGFIDVSSIFIKGTAPSFTVTIKQAFRQENKPINYFVAGSFGPYAVSTAAATIDNALTNITLSYSSSIIEITIDTTDLALHIDDPTLSDAQIQENLIKLQYYLGFHTVIRY